MTLHFPFENTYARLPDRFYARVAPTPVQAPRLIRLNTQLALDLGLDPNWLAGPQGLEVLAGRLVPDSAEPIAMAYAGHQFGHFVPNWAMGVQFCSARLSTDRASGVMSSLRVRAQLRFHDAAMAGRHWDRCCASILSAKR
jgi:uncharacterized protein YdiU (UPF0061 family)